MLNQYHLNNLKVNNLSNNLFYFSNVQIKQKFNQFSGASSISSSSFNN
jgi:hypothetical protein